MTDDIVEKLAEALWRSVAPWPDQGEDLSWEGQDAFRRNVYRHMARTAMDFLSLT
jgi:hypothetical protein